MKFQAGFSALAILLLFVLSLGSVGCKQQSQNSKNEVVNTTSNFYSDKGVETEVQFMALYKTKDYSLTDFQNSSASMKQNFEMAYISPTIKYLFGPLTRRSLGGMQTNMTVTVAWTQAYQLGQDVVIPYTYKGTWIVSKEIVNSTQKVSLPLPYNMDELQTPNWLSCTDSDPEHQTQSFFWYFWDPKRYGCDHKIDQHFQMVDLILSNQTKNTTQTFPEYKKIRTSAGIENNLQMTFAFGYVSDVEDSNPDKDSDYGMGQYRKFIQFMDNQNVTLNLQKTPILQKEYYGAQFPNKLIGYKYAGTFNNVTLQIKVVAAANIDQMQLFAKSYAHDHDGFFSWFGHSRVGSGFDAENFSRMLKLNPGYYSLTKQYQLVYWAGCNSYSYYTQPFFKQKAKINPELDPKGTKSLDIIANGLPSLFSFNADNAIILYSALLNWEKPASYQAIVTSLEKRAARSQTLVLVNILGDEDNGF